MTSSRLGTTVALVLWHAAALTASWLLLSGFWDMTPFWGEHETARGRVQVHVAVALLLTCSAWAVHQRAWLAVGLCGPVAQVAFVVAWAAPLDGYPLLLLPVLWLMVAVAAAALAVHVVGDR